MNKDIRDKSLENGWKSMLSMLDAEMPQKTKRRSLWWWLAASVAVIASFWTYSARFVDPVKNTAPQQQDVSVPMASLVPASKNIQPADTEISTPEKPTASRQVLPLPSAPAELVLLPGTMNEMGTEARNDQYTFSDSTLSGESYSYAVREIPVFASLQQITPEIVSMSGARQPVQAACTEISPVSIPTCKRGRAGIAAGAIASRSLTGASAGIIYTRHVGRRLAVRGGFAMAVFSPAQGSQPVLMFSDQNYLGATDSDFEITDQYGNTVQSQDVFTQPGQFVEVPVKNWIAAELTAMVQYKLARKLWLQTGAVGSLTARSNISPLNYTGSVILQPDKSALNSLESLAAPVVRKFSQDWITGISWFGGRHIEWGLNVRIPLNADNIKYRKLADSMMTASNSTPDVTDLKTTNLFTGSGASALLTASAIWNF